MTDAIPTAAKLPPLPKPCQKGWIYDAAQMRAYAREAIAAADSSRFNLAAHIERQRAFSERTWGPGARIQMVVDHIRKELFEIEAKPDDIAEWADVILLAFDGAWRSGAKPAQIIEAIEAKQTKNEGRTWPDWRTQDPNKAIEHDRAGEATPAEHETAIATLRHVIECLRKTGSYTDEEGEATDYLEPLLYTTSQPSRTAVALDDERAEPVASARIGTVDVIAGRVRSYTFEQTDTPDGSYSLYTAPQPPQSAEGEETVLPAWFDAFLTNVCEIPDRNSPEDEPEAIVATLEELKSCALNAIENTEPSTGTCFFCGDPIDGQHETDCPQAAAPAQSSEPANNASREANVRDRARWFVREFSRDVGFAMSDAQQEIMLNLFLRYAAPQPPRTAVVLDDDRAALRDLFEEAFNAGWDRSDDCDNAYNNGTSEQLSDPPQAQEPQVFQKWRAEYFSDRSEVVESLITRAASLQPVAQPVEQALTLTDDRRAQIEEAICSLERAGFRHEPGNLRALLADDAVAQPVEQTRALTDSELTTLIRKVEDKLGIVWFVPDDSERYAWRTTDTNERLKYARALLTAARPASEGDRE